jgi:hypothetical protein
VADEEEEGGREEEREGERESRSVSSFSSFVDM